MGILGSQYPQPIPQLQDQDLIPITSVILKDLKIPFDVSVSPFIDPGCKSFTMNFDTSTSSTPKCKLSSYIGIYPSHASYFGNMPSILSLRQYLVPLSIKRNMCLPMQYHFMRY